MIRVVQVKFDTTRTFYEYYTVIEDLRKGDYVVVDSANKVGLASVIKYVRDTGKSYSWVLRKNANSLMPNQNAIKLLREQLQKEINSV